MLGLVSAIRALTAVLSDILTQLTAIAGSQTSIETNTGTIATNTTPADDSEPGEPQADDTQPGT